MCRMTTTKMPQIPENSGFEAQKYFTIFYSFFILDWSVNSNENSDLTLK